MLLGCPEVLMERFDANVALDLIEAHRVTVLCCVSTQFILMLNAQRERARDISSLRCMFTGGEAVPYQRAAEFEDVAGAAILQFYGSNETGALSATTIHDSRETRLRTAGHLIPEMNVRVFDPETGIEVDPAEGGQPGCRGPLTSLGYWGDDAANLQLFTPDGWMLMGDIVKVDPAGRLSVVGRTSDFIIRGGKNVSAPAVEAEIATHQAVAMAVVVAVADPVFGERVAAFVTLRANQVLEFEGLTDHLRARGVSREWFPEYFAVLDELPRSSGGKVSKADLRVEAERRWGAVTAPTSLRGS
jgi:acyl-CoA synthetase